MNAEITKLVELSQYHLHFNEVGKKEFHRLSKKVLKMIADRLGLQKDQYDLRSNMGGIAVSGEVTLHSDTLYVQFGEPLMAASSVGHAKDERISPVGRITGSPGGC